MSTCKKPPQKSVFHAQPHGLTHLLPAAQEVGCSDSALGLFSMPNSLAGQ